MSAERPAIYQPDRVRDRDADDNVRDLIQVDGDALPPLLPEGTYTVQSGRAVVIRAFNARRLLLRLEVVDGEHTGARLFWCCQLPEPGRRPGVSSKFLRAWLLATNRRPRRGERLAAAALEHKRFLARVATVRKDYRGDDLAEVAQYSIVRDLVDRA